MLKDKNIQRFESELKKIDRPSMDKLLAYIRKSDFYSAPASTRYHLSCEGGLLQHSLNVLDALRGLLVKKESGAWEYHCNGENVCTIPDESVTIMALLHDLCKTHYYKTSTRNVKNEQTGKWEKAPFYTVEDRMPLGHGSKSAMLAMQFIKLTSTEMYAIWHHMGFTEQGADFGTVGKAMELHPAVLALHTADMMASRFMEDENGNKEAFADTPAGQEVEAAPKFEEAPPLEPEVQP
ncbi:MAG: hydrolase [Oscillospiraceae bacterium]|nr:hydrolase [Oscillospiraceae bacterium]